MFWAIVNLFVLTPSNKIIEWLNHVLIRRALFTIQEVCIIIIQTLPLK